MATYDEMVRRILSWSNRDREVFDMPAAPADGYTPDTAGQIKQFLQYAADKAYRTLRIPALEKTYTYTIDAENTTHANWIENNCIPIPQDLIEFISLSKAVGVGVATGCPLVYNSKVDYRTYRDSLAIRTTEAYWTRFGGNMLLSPFPGVNDGDTFELYYYGRLTRLGERLTAAQAAILNEGLTTPVYSDGSEIGNWLLTDNERILLFGALAEAFAYLGEDDMQVKFMQMFQEEIAELNREDNMRQGSGGNIQTQYTSYLL